MKVAIVTGASSGIGAATAKLLSQKSYHLLLLGRNRDRLERTKAQLEGPSHCFAFDLTDEKSIHQFVQEARDDGHLEPLQLLVNNAGVFSRALFNETDDEQWSQQFSTNLMGPVRLTRKLYPFLKRQAPSSAVVNVASTLGIKPVPQTSSYSAIKAALINWSTCLANEWSTDKIRVNCVSPGLVETPIHNIDNAKDPEELRQQMHAMQPMGRMGTAEDIAKAIVFLGCEDSKWTTGSNFTIDGGIGLL